jgi:hypothetical protein
MTRFRPIAACVACLLAAACAGRGGEDALWIAPDVSERRDQFVPQTLETSIEHLSEGDRKALGFLVRAAEAIDEIFLRQAWVENPAFRERVRSLAGPLAQAARDYYRIMYGPWDRIAELEPFLGQQQRPPGAGYYPEDMTAAEFEEWLEAHPEDREAFVGLHTVIRRRSGQLVAVPYSVEYRELLNRAAGELRAAAASTSNPSLSRFLELRANAFLDDDYFESDLAWMDLDSPIEVVIGPYETYEDKLFGYKAAFEAFLCIAQPEEEAQLAAFKDELPFLERNLPIPEEHKNLGRGSESPIRVVDSYLVSGDSRAGVQTIAFNLPNDERVREAKGSKKVLLKNVMHAKYRGILEPIAERVLAADERDRIDFDAFFAFILHHELAHGLGPGQIGIDGRITEVRLELKDHYSALEEAKADVLGVYNIYALVEKGVMDAAILDHLPWTYTAGMFRTVRFGLTEAHGRGMVLQVNYLLEKGAVAVTEDGRFQPVPERFQAAFEDLAREILMIQALGDYDGAAALFERYGTVPQAMVVGIERLEDIPVDIDPAYRVGNGS